MSQPIAVAVVGPAQHGVVLLAEQLAASAGLPVLRTDQIENVPKLSAETRMVQVHFTDRLFGADAQASADAFERFADRVGVPVAVTLHDLPMAVDEAGRYARRSQAYARVVAAARLVILSSEHEATLLRAFAPDARVTVIPLPIEAAHWCPPADRPPADRQVTVLGFVYPGKGHPEALAALPAGFGLHALGRAADGHEDYLRELAAAAHAGGRAFTVAGWVPAGQLTARLRTAAIPLVGHRQLSASGTVGDWLTAGRRPLVPDSPYTRELESRCPGSVIRYQHDDLAAALQAAADQPDRTWLARGTYLGPGRAEVADRYRQLLTAATLRGSTAMTEPL